MKAHSLCSKMVPLILNSDQKWQSYREINSSGYSQNLRKFGSLRSSNLEAIQRMKLKLCVTSCDHRYSIWTEFRRILRGSPTNFGWNGMELPLSEFKGQSFCSLVTCSPYPSSGTQNSASLTYIQLLTVKQLFAAVRLPCCLQTGNGRFLACANINLLTRHLKKLSKLLKPCKCSGIKLIMWVFCSVS